MKTDDTTTIKNPASAASRKNKNGKAKAAKQNAAAHVKTDATSGHDDSSRNGKSDVVAPPPSAGVFNATEEAETPPTPNDWFKGKFPKLTAQYGEPLDILTPKNQRPRVMDANESFFAASLGEESSPENPTVYLRSENRFYTYKPDAGIFALAMEEDLSARLAVMFLDCARACRNDADVSKLEFGFRDCAALAGVVKRAKSLLCVADDFFQCDMTEFLPVGNGVIRMTDRTLLPFAPSYRFRNKIAVPYIPEAQCPMFENILLAPAMELEDAGLLQRYCGLALCGRNVSQKIMLLTGTAGAGKGTFVRILKFVIGETNVGSLRTDQLDQRFELGLCIGRTLLYGADVPANFLSGVSATKLKALTGGDPLTGELKGSNHAVSMKGEFNVLATSNSRLTVHLEGDVGAWARRLIIIRYEKSKPATAIPDLDKKILDQEASGVLNWMLAGFFALRLANWQFKLAPEQTKRIDDLLLESDSVNVFFRDECIADSSANGITITDAFGAYSEFCFQRGWNPVARQNFGKEAPDAAQQIFRLATRHDIKGEDGKRQRGWKTLRLRAADESSPD